MNEQLKALYQSVILKHDKSPFHYGKREGAIHIIKAYNAFCGDRFDIYFDIKNGVITDISFHGFGCAISKASTSVLVKKIENLPLEKVKTTIELFLKNVTPGENGMTTSDDEITAFSAAKDFPGRQKCATLAWDEMKIFLTAND